MPTSVAERVASLLQQKGQTVWSVSPLASVLEAIQMLADKEVGALPVVADGRLVGIFSERDYTRKVALQGRSSKDARVRDVMTSPVVFVTPDHSVDDCMRIMTNSRIRHLPVVDREQVVGIVSIGDVVKRVMSAQGEVIDQLQGYITGKYPG